MLSSFFSAPESFSYAEVQQALDGDSFDIEHFLAEISVTQLLAVETEAPNKGRSLLWLLALTAQKHPSYFLRVWEKFNKEITLKDILVTAASGNGARKSLLWLIAFVECSGEKTPFLQMWNRFHEALTLADLRQAPQEGLGLGINLLHFLANLAVQGHPALFHSIWEKYEEEFSTKDFQSITQEGSLKGSSTLWLLARAAIHHQPKTFFSVWEKLRTQFTYSDLVSSVELAPGKNVTLLDLFLSLDLEGERILYEIVTQIPGLPDDKFMPSLHAAVSSEFYEEAKDIFSKKKPLFTMMTLLQRKKLLDRTGQGHPFTEEELTQLFTLGETALAAGYVNAFYEISQLLKDTNHHNAAAQARRRHSILSWHHEIPVESRVKQFYELALAAPNLESREKNLETALYFATQIKGKNKANFIQKIGYCYVTGRNDFNPTTTKTYLSLKAISTTYSSADFIRISDLLKRLKEQRASSHQKNKPDVDALTVSVSAGLTFSPAHTQRPVSTTNSQKGFSLPPPPPSFSAPKLSTLTTSLSLPPPPSLPSKPKMG